MTSRLQQVPPDSEAIVSKGAALTVIIAAASGLQHVLKSSLSPQGTLKMLGDGAGQIKQIASHGGVDRADGHGAGESRT